MPRSRIARIETLERAFANGDRALDGWNACTKSYEACILNLAKIGAKYFALRIAADEARKAIDDTVAFSVLSSEAEGRLKEATAVLDEALKEQEA